MKKNNILLLTLFGIIFFILFLCFSEKKIYFYMNGNKNVEIDINSEYVDEGVYAKYCNKYIKILCKDLSNNVKLNKKVDKENNNIFYINYSLKINNHNRVLTRTIVKKDKESPIIKLINNKAFACPNKEYEEDGYYAYDNVDGDLTNKVIKEIKNNKVYYSVSDSSNNKKIVYRDIEYKDEQKPTIELFGNHTNYVFLNTDYIEEGYQAIDNCDEDITKSVVIESNVDTSRLGEYNIKYTVRDSSGNQESIDRKVIVYDDTSNIEKNGKVIYLTFDDGPNIYTEEILKILDKYRIKATFFVTNQFSDYQHLIKKSYNNGHSIGVHTYTHNFDVIYSSVDEYMKDFNNMNKIIYEQTGQYSNIFRFPGGSSNTISKFNKGIMTTLTNKMINDGYKYYDWNIDSNDTSAKNSDEIYKNVINEVDKYEHSIVLLHDIKKLNIESVDMIIKFGLENGYTFLPIDDTTPMIHHSVNN